jgi:hypothetical protein
MEFYATASADVRQSIISRADPPTTRTLCQIDRRSRAICRDRLTLEQKYKVCLDKDGSAQECDLIPMFSQHQFLAVIPKNISIYPNDEVQMTHQFYSQQYKLPTEGFAIALRKAKIMNTICAAVRPDFLLNPISAQLKLPPYVDATILEWVINNYKKTFPSDDYDEYFRISVELYDRESLGKVLIECYYEEDEDDGMVNDGSSVTVNHTKVPLGEYFFDKMLQDKYLQYYHALIEEQMGSSYYAVFPLIGALEGPRLNVFQLSRFIKIAMDMGYFYHPVISIDSRTGTRFNRVI